MKKSQILVKYIVPSVLSSFVSYLYVITDGAFVGNGIGQDAVGAINIVIPYIMLYNALIMLCSIGGMTITAIRIGRNDIESANISFMHCILLCVVISSIMSIAGVFKTELICYLLGASEQFIKLASEYLFYCAIFFVPGGLYIAFNAIVRTDDEPALVSMAVIVTSVGNIFGDWLLMFPLHMGIKGAALATGISYTIGFFILLTHFLRKKGILRFNLCKVDISLIKKIIVRGTPECINQFSVPAMTLCMNQNIAKYIGDVGINVFALVCYVASIATSYFAGVTEGIQPLYGKAYGENNENDVRYFYRSALVIGIVGAIIIILLLNVFSSKFYLLFNPEKEVIEMAVKVTTIFSLCFIPLSINIIIASYLYSTTKTKFAVIINVLRCIVINIIVITVVSIVSKAKYIWFSPVIYESIVMIIAIVLSNIADKNGIILDTKE